MTSELTNEITTNLDYLVDDGLGGEEQLNTEVMSIPFVKILQSLSPQCKKNNPAYVPNAGEGMLYNTVANEVIEPPVRAVIVRFERYYAEWKFNRGGFAGMHTPAEVTQLLTAGKLQRNDYGRIVNFDTGTEFSDTYAYYVVFPDKPDWGVCLFCLSGTQLKEARRWNRQIVSKFIPGTRRRAHIYQTVWTISTPEQSNDKGSWAGFKVDFAGFVDEDVYKFVVSERQTLAQDNRQANFKELGDSDNATSTSSYGGETTYVGTEELDDMPF